MPLFISLPFDIICLLRILRPQKMMFKFQSSAIGSAFLFICPCTLIGFWVWTGGAKVLGNLPVPGRPTIWMIVGQGPIALAIGAGGGCLDIFTLLFLFSSLSPSLWETARYRLKYCL